MDTNATLSDHDLLIKLNENVTSMREEFRTNNKMFTDKISDHEARLRLVEAANERNEGGNRTIKIILSVGGVLVAAINVFVVWYVGSHK